MLGSRGTVRVWRTGIPCHRVWLGGWQVPGYPRTVRVTSRYCQTHFGVRYSGIAGWIVSPGTVRGTLVYQDHRVGGRSWDRNSYFGLPGYSRTGSYKSHDLAHKNSKFTMKLSATCHAMLGRCGESR